MLDGIDITQVFEKVITTLNALCLYVHDELKDYPVWTDNGAGELITDRDKIIYVLKQLTLMEGISPQETFAFVGAIGANAAALALIETVNQAKDVFREEVNRYMATSQTRDTAIIRRLLALSGYPGIKLKQVFRHIRTI